MRFPTMKSCRIQVVSLILIGLISMPAHAEVIPGRWEKVSDLELGTPITVELKNGDRVKGEFAGLFASDVEVGTHFARAVIPKADIQTIATQKKGGTANGARKGTIIGAAAGAGVGAAGMMVTLANRDGNEDLGEAQGLFLLFVPAVATGIGTALGIVVGAATKSDAIVVYKAPETPSVPSTKIRKEGDDRVRLTEINGNTAARPIRRRGHPPLPGSGSRPPGSGSVDG